MYFSPKNSYYKNLGKTFLSTAVYLSSRYNLLIVIQQTYKTISSNNIPAIYNSYLVWWILLISVGNQYKLLFCGGLGKMLGFEWICYTMIHHISTNHWFEHLVYVPLLWMGLNHINSIVFGPHEQEVLSKKMKYKKWLGQFLCALYIYGHGIHITNTLELLAKDIGQTNGVLYEQIWWLDEHLSHWLQFSSFFLLIAYFITQDRLDRQHGKYIAIITGILHGIDRGVGLIEGNSPVLGIGLAIVIGLACLYRWRRHDSNFKRVWKDFFFRHGLCFVVSSFSLLVCYHFIFGIHQQPSAMPIAEVPKVVGLCLAILLAEICLILGIDRYNQ